MNPTNCIAGVPGERNTSGTFSFYSGHRLMILYQLNGGENSWMNATYLDGNEELLLHKPHRNGFSFEGWYLDSSFKRSITRIYSWQMGYIRLYAKWNDGIDNYGNVEDYPYSSSGTNRGQTIRLKDCVYDFCEDVNIPGMPSTQNDSILNSFIFSESQCPQGLCITEEFYLMTSYSQEEDRMGELLVFDRYTGEILVTLGMDEQSHLGGIAYDGKNVWICNSKNRTLERISYDFIQLMARKNKGKVIDARSMVDAFSVDNVPSCITYNHGRLWVATHTIVMNSKMIAYYYDAKSNSLKALNEYAIPSQVQGITFSENGEVILSTSYGRTRSSYLKIYRSTVELSAKPNRPFVQIEMPPGSEEVDYANEQIFCVFESAGNKYYLGTDGRGTSICPLDKILVISMDSILK